MEEPFQSYSIKCFCSLWKCCETFGERCFKIGKLILPSICFQAILSPLDRSCLSYEIFKSIESSKLNIKCIYPLTFWDGVNQSNWMKYNEWNKFILRPVHPICPSHTAHPPTKFTLYSPSERIRTPRYPPCLLLFIFGEKWPQWVASTWVARGRWTGWTANPLMISPGRTHPTGFARTTFAAPPRPTPAY